MISIDSKACSHPSPNKPPSQNTCDRATRRHSTPPSPNARKSRSGCLHEYRTRLIADVVTGKLDVRKAAAALPEIDPLAADDNLDGTLNTDDV